MSKLKEQLAFLKNQELKAEFLKLLKSQIGDVTSDKFKTIEFVRLHYIDKSAGARISVKVSTDGGAAWTTKTKSIGTGNSKGKTKDFHFITTGQIFRFAIESISVSDEFQWVGLEAVYSVGGDYFES